jgi:glycosyltransferase involved in cell wall biosynthesis
VSAPAPVAYVQNAARERGAPVSLSVLIPFFKDDPSALLAELEAMAPEGVEICLLDDGTGDSALTRRLAEQVTAMTCPARLITLVRNAGRASGRNILAGAARGGHLLFVDSDMLPDDPGYLLRWRELASRDNPAVAFGGFSLKRAPDSAPFALHRAIAAHGECLDAAQRARDPAKHVFTSNLLVRRDVLDAHAFDDSFSGWGWEDVEWAMRVARHHHIVHIDNTASHLGLDTPEALVAKYEQSPANFARMIARHPEVVSRYPSYRVARMIRALPLRSVFRRILRAAVLASSLPGRVRARLLRLYRAALYAEVVR